VNVLAVRDLTVDYRSAGRPVEVLRGVDLCVAAGEKVGLVGESGAGKSTLALALLRLLPHTATVRGEIRVAGTDVGAANWGRLRALRWTGASLVFQGAMHALNPVRRVGPQIAEPMLVHGVHDRRGARERVGVLLDRVGLPAAGARAYPHELSGGQRQRAVLAMALACAPRLLIVDEPTASLDVVSQAQILRMLGDLVDAEGVALLMISHDLPVVTSSCDRLAVLHEGRIVEDGQPDRLLAAGAHAYTRDLARAVPRIGGPRPLLRDAPVAHDGAPPVVSVRDLRVAYPSRRGAPAVRAVDGVDLDLWRGEIVALVGESGCGKTTLVRSLLGLQAPTAGTVRLTGAPVDGSRRSLRALHRRVQLVPQDPVAALNPRHTVYRAVAEGLRVQGGATDERATVLDALQRAGLRPPERYLDRYPGQLSGGQCQRVVIAGALAVDPLALLADEPFAALDAPVRAELVALLAELRDRFGLATLLVTHDLSLAWAAADRVAVMYLGRVVEHGPTAEVLTRPAHPYTRALLAALPALPGAPGGVDAAAHPRGGEPPDPALGGEPPDPAHIPAGCRLHPRCPVVASGAADRAGVGVACRTADLPVVPAAGHGVACHYPADRPSSRATSRRTEASSG
jgi:peptide/nickel transport system ATP-binding protein